MWKLIVDSGCNFRSLPRPAVGVDFASVPFTIQVEDQVFVDDASLDIAGMMSTMYASSSVAKSACASPEAFAQALEGADKAIIITITGALSGSYNAARLGKDMYLETHPEAQVHVIDSLSAGGQMDLLALKANGLMAADLSFEQVVEEMTAYQAKTKLLFALAKVDNLVKNGRLSKLVGTVVGLLNIRMVGQASAEGTLELLQKSRGQKKAVAALLEELDKAGYAGGRVMIAHATNDKICQQLEEGIKAKFPAALVEAIPTTGLCSFYAEEGGILMGYEI